MKKNSVDYVTTADSGAFDKFKGFFKKRITLMLIPHSEKKVFNVQVSLFSIIGVITLFVALLFSFFILSSGYSGSLRVIDDRDGRIIQAEADLYRTSEAVEKLNEGAEKFKQAINRTLQTVNINNSGVDGVTGRGGDLNNLLNIQESDASSSSDVKTIDSVTALLNNSIPQLEELTDQMEKKVGHFVDMPSILPLKNVIGRFTLSFGPQKEPFTGKWYLHRGLDIAYSRGTQIVATANGKVEVVEYQPSGYGNSIVISHKWSYNTRYAHLDKVLVSKGQWVKQGDVIGLMGSTGRSTGPHLHYEVRIGPTYVNPADYIGSSN
ncbi:M23 family metallopeptidase [Thiospirochaeta perfilievii]|uniref:M23 family metallopeptidase n=1 Tax=Thiospirochaeta perfilievii TaxID=252967 RepID=A0A5C1Q963_9SPIO|nr:M23 family metallopeptidase [Thiospirochaeta perfilievii]QEN03600.1 M23 family metallopeptidase [Thiospirochaeta perfilievii]